MAVVAGHPDAREKGPADGIGSATLARSLAHRLVQTNAAEVEARQLMQSAYGFYSTDAYRGRRFGAGRGGFCAGIEIAFYFLWQQLEIGHCFLVALMRTRSCCYYCDQP